MNQGNSWPWVYLRDIGALPSRFAYAYRRDRHSEIAWVGCTDELEPTCGKKLSIQIVPKAVRAQRVPVVYLDEDRSPSSVTAKSIA